MINAMQVNHGQVFGAKLPGVGEECAEGLLEAFCGLDVFQEWEECSWVG